MQAAARPLYRHSMVCCVWLAAARPTSQQLVQVWSSAMRLSTKHPPARALGSSAAACPAGLMEPCSSSHPSHSVSTQADAVAAGRPAEHTPAPAKLLASSEVPAPAHSTPAQHWPCTSPWLADVAALLASGRVPLLVAVVAAAPDGCCVIGAVLPAASHEQQPLSFAVRACVLHSSAQHSSRSARERASSWNDTLSIHVVGMQQTVMGCRCCSAHLHAPILVYLCPHAAALADLAYPHICQPVICACAPAPSSEA